MTLPNGTSGLRAKCKFCHKDYATSTGGTGHLRRHMHKCMSAHGQDYLCVTGHYLDSDWRITKRIFGFRLHPIDFAHTAENIFNVIMEVLETYEITHRILSITFDNASANTSSIVLFVARNIPQDGGQLSPKLLTTDDWFGNIDIPQSTRPETEPKQPSWSLLKRRKKEKLASTSSGQRSSPYSCTKLIRYLEAQFDAVEDKEEFDLLLWWKTYTYRYPVLSHLARDVLVILVSTVSSEQAFSTSGRIIEPRRSCLSPEMVEVLTCLRDWEHAKKWLQNLTVDKELNLNFDNLYIDDPSGSGHGQN
ncbi:hypothetical protein Ddye_025717 [Dipteronia dyeriana]|uniref:BED-type domain-containing protein n=1 Tax=Dipteronia dyeriana TaxID=168575 RepID=A0AAD9WPP9_9ROSI|nr:hypothetical protein Ddye_025717 [Dipteronia dyeriana]